LGAAALPRARPRRCAGWRRSSRSLRPCPARCAAARSRAPTGSGASRSRMARLLPFWARRGPCARQIWAAPVRAALARLAPACPRACAEAAAQTRCALWQPAPRRRGGRPAGRRAAALAAEPAGAVGDCPKSDRNRWDRQPWQWTVLRPLFPPLAAGSRSYAASAAFRPRPPISRVDFRRARRDSPPDRSRGENPDRWVRPPELGEASRPPWQASRHPLESPFPPSPLALKAPSPVVPAPKPPFAPTPLSAASPSLAALSPAGLGPTSRRRAGAGRRQTPADARCRRIPSTSTYDARSRRPASYCQAPHAPSTFQRRTSSIASHAPTLTPEVTWCQGAAGCQAGKGDLAGQSDTQPAM
jgi:hypothetical protein